MIGRNGLKLAIYSFTSTLGWLGIMETVSISSAVGGKVISDWHLKRYEWRVRVPKINVVLFILFLPRRPRP